MPPEFDILWEAWQALRENSIYGGELDAKSLSEGAVHGMMQSLDDPYAAYLDPELYSMQQEDLEGSFEGVGARVAMRNGQVMILAPLPGSPAESAGIRPGDIIIEVDGESTVDMNLYEVVALIRGPSGTTVSLGIQHEGEDKPVTIDVTRERIDVPSVTLVEMLPGDVAHVRIEEFSDDTDEEFEAVRAEIQKEGARGLVLDLRNNPGGILESVVNTASWFLKDGLVLYEIDSKGSRTEWQVRKVGQVIELPIVVLVNQFSASGSEVLAGALQDRGEAIVVGEKTFGKGSVNTLQPLSDGSAVYYTIARWYTPNGRLIEGEGLQPDITVESQPGSPADEQLERALEELRTMMEAS
jgi:carboxyl-terminal processing protease